ncbi:MAG: hypothetical protein K2K55_10490 [Duncaniella sp.]|nr:hypothetical protein [Duncaniella sp.]
MIERYRILTGFFFGALWTLLCYGFVRDEFMPFLGPLQSYANLLCDLVFLCLGLVTIRNRSDLLWGGSLVALAVVSGYINHESTVTWINGMRDYFGILFTVPFIRYMLSRPDYAGRFTEQMDKALRWFLYLQVICVTWQFIRYGANDAGGGTMGYGHSGVVSTLIYIVSFYLMVKRWDYDESYWANLIHNRLLIFLLLPTFLNETKISFFFFIGYFVFLMKIDRRFFFRLLMAIPLGIVALAGLLFLYLKATHIKLETILSEKFYYEYFVGEDIHDLAELGMMVYEEEIETDNFWATDLPRFGRFILVPDALATTKGGLMLGAGIGQFKGNDVLSETEFARKNYALVRGSVPLALAWVIQLGLVGLVWFLAFILHLIFSRDPEPFARNLRFYTLMIFTMILAYQDQYALVYYCAIVFYIYLVGLQARQSLTRSVES